MHACFEERRFFASLSFCAPIAGQESSENDFEEYGVKNHGMASSAHKQLKHSKRTWTPSLLLQTKATPPTFPHPPFLYTSLNTTTVVE